MPVSEISCHSNLTSTLGEEFFTFYRHQSNSLKNDPHTSLWGILQQSQIDALVICTSPIFNGEDQVKIA